jgi:hypothetical protein
LPFKSTNFLLLFLALLIISEAQVNAEQSERLQSLLEKARQRKATQTEGKVNSTKSLEDSTRELPSQTPTTPTRDLGYQSTKVLSTVDKTSVSKDVQATVQTPAKPPETSLPSASRPQAPTSTSSKPTAVVNQTIKVSQPPVASNISNSKSSSVSSKVNVKPNVSTAFSAPKNPYLESSLSKPDPKAVKNTVAANPTPKPKTSLQTKREENQARKSTPYIQRDDKIKDDFITSTSVNIKQENKKKSDVKPTEKKDKQEYIKTPKLGYEDQLVKKPDNKSKTPSLPVLDLSNFDTRPKGAYISTDMDGIGVAEDSKKQDEELLTMLQAYKETVRNEIKGNSREVFTSSSVIGIEVPKPADTLTNNNGKNPENSASENDYLLVLKKSLKSLEEDSWAQVKQNMGESLDYFAREKSLHPDDSNLDLYHRVIMGFSRFAEGGLELDEGDFADFEEAEALYLDCLDILEDAKSRIKKDDAVSNSVKNIINSVIKYTDEELEYIEQMIGL